MDPPPTRRHPSEGPQSSTLRREVEHHHHHHHYTDSASPPTEPQRYPLPRIHTPQDDILGLSWDNMQQHPDYSRGRPIDWYMNSNSTTGAILSPDARLGPGHPTECSPMPFSYSHNGSELISPMAADAVSTVPTESEVSRFEQSYGSGYPHSAATSWSNSGSPTTKSALLVDINGGQANPQPMCGSRSPVPPEHSLSGAWDATVNPQEVNRQSAGAVDDTMDTGDDDTHDTAYSGFLAFCPQPQEVQPSSSVTAVVGYDHQPRGVSRPRNPHYDGASTKLLCLPADGSKFSRHNGKRPRKTHQERKLQHKHKQGTQDHSTTYSSQRPFLCTFHFAGCLQTFSTKNEWKRHVSSQHLQTYIWRCDFPTCAGRKTATFNRKDLFGQHLKRMHVPPDGDCNSGSSSRRIRRPQSPTMQQFASIEVPKIQERCRIERRPPPERSTCGFCAHTRDSQKVFSGPGSWEKRMEHVGRHYENALVTGENVGPTQWRQDDYLVAWAIREGLVTEGANGSYVLPSVGKDAVVERFQ